MYEFLFIYFIRIKRYDVYLMLKGMRWVIGCFVFFDCFCFVVGQFIGVVMIRIIGQLFYGGPLQFSWEEIGYWINVQQWKKSMCHDRYAHFLLSCEWCAQFEVSQGLKRTIHSIQVCITEPCPACLFL